MTKFEVFNFFVVFLIAVMADTEITDTSDVIRDVNNRMLAAIDDLFIYLKINVNLTKPKLLENFMSVQDYIQAKLSRNRNMHKEINKIIKTNVSNEIADKICNINDGLDEMIRELTVTSNDSIRNYSITFPTKSYDDYVDLERVFKEKFKSILLNNITSSRRGPITSRELAGRRIFAGKDTAIKRYPFLVSVHVAQQFVCAGSLLHKSLALSAASCVMRTRDDPTSEVQIRIGSDYVTKMGSLVHIEEILYHPEFDQATLANNLAFLKTKRALRFVQEKVVAITYDKYDSVMLRGGQEIVILGWGRRSDSDSENITDRPLSRARLNLYDLEDCKYIYTREYVGDKNFCAGFTDRGDGACNHDGGGPAVAGSLLTGVISFGSPQCGRSDAPTVFTRLSLYAVWIESVLESVKIPNNPQTIPQTFHVPTSVEFGKESEVTIEDTAPEDPIDALKKEFGLGDILNGPIDKGNKKGQNKTKFTSDNVDLSGFTAKPTMVSPKPLLSVHIADGEIDYQIDEAITNATNVSNSKISSTKIMETITTEKIDDELLTDPENTTDANQIEADTDSDQKKCDTLDSCESESESSDDTSNESGCFDDECKNKNGIDPILEDNTSVSRNDTAYIIMGDFGTTKRVAVDKGDEMYGRVVKVMKALVKAVEKSNNEKKLIPDQ